MDLGPNYAKTYAGYVRSRQDLPAGAKKLSSTVSHNAFEPLPETSLGAPTYHYRGRCPISDEELSLPRTTLAQTLARSLSQTLDWSEGKMLGVLLVRERQGRLGYGKAFSGLMDGQAHQPGWAPPLHSSSPLPSEAPTLEALDNWKMRLEKIAGDLASHPYPPTLKEWQARDQQLRALHKASKVARQKARESGAELATLQAQSRHESRQRKDFRLAMTAALSPLHSEFMELQTQLLEGRGQRRDLSRALQKEMHEGLGQTLGGLLGLPLNSLFPTGVPTGTGDCCAPKLLAWAAENHLRPLALAEMWWGPTSVGGKVPAQFYPACEERCRPLLGPLLSLALRDPIAILHEDEKLLVAVKPSGLLTVPGRYHWNQDSLSTRLNTFPVHRLDLETSGLVVLARDKETQSALRHQFEEGSVVKVYEALLVKRPELDQGRIDSPQARDPEHPGRYRLDGQGKSARTDYRMLDDFRVELRPLTGRSHQLRVHMAQALDCAIRGDRLYGSGGERLKLHACGLELTHPTTGERMQFSSPAPF